MIISLFCYTMEIDMKNKSVNAFYTAEILALVVALIFFAAGMPKVVGYACEKNHTTGNVTYQSSRQGSHHVKVHSGNNVRNYKSRYGKGIRSTHTVLQIKANSSVTGADVFWYEGNCISVRKIHMEGSFSGSLNFDQPCRNSFYIMTELS